MKNLGMLLTSVFMTVAGKLLTAFGVAAISYVGLDYMQGKFINWFQQSISSIPTDALQIFYIAGGGVALNWFFGAFAFVASLKSLSHFGTILGSK